MTTDRPVELVAFYGGPLHGFRREAVIEGEAGGAPPDVWMSAEPAPDGRGAVMVEYEKAPPWWVPEQDTACAAVYICRSWVRPDGQMRSRHGHSY